MPTPTFNWGILKSKKPKKTRGKSSGGSKGKGNAWTAYVKGK
jgi:hypothetical protein